MGANRVHLHDFTSHTHSWSFPGLLHVDSATSDQSSHCEECNGVADYWPLTIEFQITCYHYPLAFFTFHDIALKSSRKEVELEKAPSSAE
jgi:hypothetical protein